ncbi:MAG: CRISPR-associated protein Cas2 [Clostridiales bacterium]|jgi:CRISPR-associated protein Cas2|nr:CRISPR-associated protein Cas2 [Clostridiales bacterium]MDK2991169.1 CRISPR-associated protein Cas2 [Clostridiales bacterium]
MKTLVIFDIPSNKIRNKIGEACKDYGLMRIQKSSFFGDINNNRREELRLRLKKILDIREGNIQMFPICDKDLQMRKVIINQKEELSYETDN